MSPLSVGRARRLIPTVFVVLLMTVLYFVARLPEASAADRASMAAKFHFTPLPIAMPPGLPDKSIREVNGAYEHIRAWISAVGAGVAINDLENTGVANGLCLVDPRSDSVIVTPAPGTGSRFEPFVLQPAPLPFDDTMAPMGCVPGDFNADARMDLLVYYWGRTPVVFMGAPTGSPLSLSSYIPTELIPQEAPADGKYHGQLWNTNAVSVADFDGDGHVDIGLFNYFPNSKVLQPDGQQDVTMNHTMSKAQNGGGAHIMRWTSATSDPKPSVRYEEQRDAIDTEVATGWSLGAGSADLDGDLLPELYIANDFGNDHFFHNVSTPGSIKFDATSGRRGFVTPKSMVLGHDSFKGMSIDFGDLGNQGKFDMFVSNITTSWGLEESNFVWMNNASSESAARTKLAKGTAPFDNKASKLNMAQTGWGWDAKLADLDNSGNLSVVQAAGFVKGSINRWPWLQELAMSNDVLIENPAMWPKAVAGDDISGDEGLAFWVRESTGRYVNLSHELGLDVPIPTRGVAVADTDGDGAQDFAVARQWGPPVFYHNDHAGSDDFLGLRLYRPLAAAATGTATATAPGTAPAGQPGTTVAGSPAYGARVTITTADGHTQISQLDGGSGHSGKRGFDVFFGLGSAGDKPVSAAISWRDLSGQTHQQTLDLTHGWHTLILDSNAQEVATP